tara:strand:- start:348 stop:773 length:426 start_codon:yes stop_codon:yes gene_type:complete
MDELEKNLKRPYPAHKIKFRKGGGSKELAYIDARNVMDRLDEVVGVANWQTKYHWIGNRMICELSVNIDGTWITKSDGADDSNIEGAKGGISDALKRAAVLFGIGRYLYYPNAFDRDNKPAVWATPEGWDEIHMKREKEKA